MNSVRAELALVIRVVNLAFGKLTPEQQDRVEIVADDLLDEVILAGDRDRTLTEITSWRDRQLKAIGRAAR